MPADDIWGLIAVGALGGLVLNGLNFIKRGHQSPADRPPLDGHFWFAIAFWPFIGALLVFLAEASGNQLNAFGAFVAGMTGPPTLQAILDSAGSPNAGRTETGPSEE